MVFVYGELVCAVDGQDLVLSIFRCVLHVFRIVFHIFPGFLLWFWRKIGGFWRFTYRSVGTFGEKLTLFVQSVRITHIFW